MVSASNHWDKAKTNEVSVTFTLSSAAAKVIQFLGFTISAFFKNLNVQVTICMEFCLETEPCDDGHGTAAEH